MKRNYKLLAVTAAVFLGTIASYTSASSWNLPGIDVVTRAQRGADESLKYTSRAEYQEMIRLAGEREKYMTEMEHEHAEGEAEKSRISREYALANFPNDILLDMVVDAENGNKLWRKKEYLFNKTKILVHHTVNDLSKFSSEESVKSLLRSVYRMHAISNGWGDIGYNFVISPGGVIYEGRSGGDGVVGAHATWNNQPSVGIALIGNFEVDQPTQAQINALVKLSTALAAKYNINPMTQVDYHKKTSYSPYVTTFQNFALASHRDVGATACPGINLYRLLPAIRDRVAVGISSYIAANPSIKNSSPKPVTPIPSVSTGSVGRPTLPAESTASVPNLTKTQLTLTPALGITADVHLIRTRTSNMGTTLPRCQLVYGDVVLSGCMYKGGELIVGVRKKNGNMNPGTVRVKAISRSAEVTFDINLAWQSKTAVRPSLPSAVKPVATMPNNPVVTSPSAPAQTNSLLVQRKLNFPITTPNGITKIKTPVSESNAPSLMRNDVSVLLHNASILSSSWTFICSGTCSMSNAPFTTITVTSQNGILTIQKNGLTWKESNIILQAGSGSTIAVLDSVSRKQYGIYRGRISLIHENIRKIDGHYVNQFALVNTLPMEFYLAGIAEASDREPIEKTKVLALLAKAYALYYIGGSGPHPSIPQGASYQAIDDPRFFQKYNGVTWERTSKNRPIAMAQTKDTYVVYNNILPMLPYFHCSPGFTRSAREKYGWTDTPYLQSVLDESGCTTFEGHGVGLSGQGATRKAQNGEKAEDIIKYYYQGVEVKKLY